MDRLQGRPKLFDAFDLCVRLFLASLLVSIVAAQLFAGILVVLWIVLWVRGMSYKRTLLDFPILIYVAIRTLSIVFSENPSLSATAITRELVYYSSYFFSVFYVQHARHAEVDRTLKWLVGSTLIVVAIASVEFLLGGSDRARALTGGGRLSTHVCFVFLALLTIGKHRGIALRPTHWYAALALLILGLIFTLTRGDLIALIVSLVAYTIVFERRLLIGMSAILGVSLIVLGSFRDRVLYTIADPLGQSSDRIALWQGAASRAGEHPFLGFGPETFHAVYDNWANTGDKGIGSWHNDAIQLYMESGLFGLAAWVTVLALTFTMSIRLIRTRSDPELEHKLTGWMGVLLLIAYVVIGIFGSPTVSITNAMLFRFFLALIGVQYLRLQDKRASVVVEPVAGKA